MDLSYVPPDPYFEFHRLTHARCSADRSRMNSGTRKIGNPAASRRGGHCLVAIGASTGGPAALAELLRGLPLEFHAAVVIVQHVDTRFVPGLVQTLQEASKLPVRIAEAGIRVEHGIVYVAGGDDHLVLHPGRLLSYCSKPLDCFYRPSIDVFFESASRHWRGDVIGVILTGMGSDGAVGLRRLRENRHHTIGQDRATCAVYGMPKAAAESDAVTEVMPLGRIAEAIVRRVRFHV